VKQETNMAKSNVVNINPAVQKTRAPKKFEFPKPIREALWKQQERVYEALGVARMLESYVMNAGSNDRIDVDDLENTVRGLVRLLEPIEGLNDVTHLKQLVESDEVSHG
jgi:hypothetical protein